MQKVFITAIMAVIAAVLPCSVSAVNSAVDERSSVEMQQNATRKVSGKVVDKAGQPLEGVSVLVPGTGIGVITDKDGNFTLDIPANAQSLDVSCLGFTSVTLPVTTAAVYNTSLEEDNELLKEVVVVGYGVQKKVNLTGSVASMNVEQEMKSRTVTNLSNSLAGMMAGVTALQSSGAPGSDGANIRVRGLGTLNNSSPLIIIDGIEGSIDSVNPQDVESISVLKDAASSAIYGARAANGVVLVTTKKGTRGQTRVTYSAHASVLTPSSSYDFVTNYADYMELMNESATNVGTSAYFSDETIRQWRSAEAFPNAKASSGYPNYVAYPNTDWEDELFGAHVLNEHTVQLNGGTDKIRYLMSAGYQDNPGIVDNTGQKKYTLRTSIEADVTSWLTVGNRTYVSQQDQDISNWGTANTYLMATNPGTYPYYDGYYGASAASEENAQDNNLQWYLDRGQGHNRITRFNTTLYSTVKFLKHFSWDMNFNYVRQFQERRTWDKGTQQKMNFATGVIASTMTDLAVMTTNTSNYGSYNYTLEHLLHYNQTIGKHELTGLLGYDEYYYYYENLTTQKKGLLDYTLTVPSSATEMVGIEGNAHDTATRSAFGRINYAFDQKYLFEANLRYDGSSRFSKNYRWGLFPSFSAGWRLSEEGFMKSSPFSNLKLRASWGRLGNSSISEYLYQSTYSSNNYSFGGAQKSGLGVYRLSNEALQWETTEVTNIGIDAAFLDNKLQFVIDAYNKATSGILYQPSIYLTAGYKAAPYKNIAEVTNKGIEFTASYKGQVGDFRFNVSGNITYNHNRVSKYKGKLEAGFDEEGNWTTNLGDVSTGGTTRILEGHEMSEYYLLNPYKGNGGYFNEDGTVNITGGPKDGMIRTEADMEWVNAMIDAGYKFQPQSVVGKGTLWYGDYIYADINGDGIYGSSYDYTFQGCSSRAPIFYGFQINLGWKDFDLSGTFSGAAKYKLYWSPGTSHSTLCRLGYELSSEITDDHYFFDPDNPDDERTNTSATYGRLVGEGGYQANAASTLYLFKANYLKLKNLTLGYTLPKKLVEKSFINSLRLYLNTENVFTLTKYPGMDPELGAGYVYMPSRSFSIGANITF